MPGWQSKVQVAHGPLWRGPLRARIIQDTLNREGDGGWELVSTASLTHFGFTSAVWLIFPRPA
jgi:hypothetical protein